MKRPKIHFSLFVLALLSISFCFQCQPLTSNGPVGSSKDTEIPNMNFTIDTTFISYSQLFARGTAKNNGGSKVNPPWYVECQFYADSTFSLDMGGSNTVINIPLNPGISTFWTISFSSLNVDVRSYPRFRVKDVRAIYKN